jgi:hypothetical protein
MTHVEKRLTIAAAALMILGVIATPSGAQSRSSTLQVAPDSIADVLGKFLVAMDKCGFQTNDKQPMGPLVAKLGGNLDDWRPDGRYDELMLRSIYRALHRVGLTALTQPQLGEPQACAALNAEVAKAMPDVVVKNGGKQ